MLAPEHRPPKGRRRPRHGLSLPHAALVVLVTAVLIFTQVPVWPVNPLLAAVRVTVGACYAVTAGLLAAEAGQRGNNRLFVLMAVLWTTGQLDERPVGPLPLIGLLTGMQVDVVLAAVLLRWPGSHMERGERRFILGAAVWTTAVQLVWVLTVPAADLSLGPAAWWPAPWSNRDLAVLIDRVALAAILIMIALFLRLLWSRWRRVHGLDRGELAPVLAAGAAAAALLFVFQVSTLLPVPGWLFTFLHAFSDLARVAVPGAFLAAALTRRLVREAVADLVVRLSEPDSLNLRDALRDALRDPDLRVVYWIQERAAYVDESGAVVCLEATRQDLRVPVETRDGEPLAVVLADPTVARHPHLLRAVTAASRLALENARLQASLLTRLREVEDSRARLMQAELAERRRLERDLHDGAQQRLLALKTRLGVARAQATDPAVTRALELARDELGLALRELRDLAHGIHPALLTDTGLRAAIECVADRLPFPVIVDIPDRRYRADLETALYYFTCEALANVAKHAGPCSVTVTLDETNGQLPRSVRLEVADSGAGGARLREWHGLSGLQDRLAVLGGSLTVDSPPSQGTRVRATIPCG